MENIIELYPVLDSLNQVAEFHRVFDHPVQNSPCIPDRQRCELRYNLLKEEVDELKDAIETRDIVGIADALCDIQYVLSGAVLEFGMQSKFRLLFEEVHRSNMSKSCATEEEAKQTRDKAVTSSGVDHHYESRNGRWFVYRTSDMKTVKSIYYSLANLEKFL